MKAFILLLGCSAALVLPTPSPRPASVGAVASSYEAPAKTSSEQGRWTKKKAKTAAGFGAKKPQKKPALGKAAAKLLEEHRGDIDAAQAERFDAYMEKLRRNDPELFADVARVRRCDPDGPARGREKLLAMTWDVVADYLPTETVDASLDARLSRVAAFARGRCLDVGCGDGSMVPHLRERTYRGVDLSGRMVDLARKRHPDAQFAKAGFFEFLARESTAWDTILFVAALQFFPDVGAVLSACASHLAPGGRVVIAHARGAAFVREERRGNPAVVKALPAVEDLLATGEFGLAHAGDDLDDFYLVVLERT
jgi:SAM-dependent methyltransferase